VSREAGDLLRMIRVNVVKIGRAVCDASSAKWNLGNKSAFALGPRKTMENLDRVDRAQEKSIY
jgi:hypothetical protein